MRHFHINFITPILFTLLLTKNVTGVDKFLAANVGKFPKCEILQRTFCKDIQDYPEDRIIHLIQNRLFNLSSLIVSEVQVHSEEEKIDTNVHISRRFDSEINDTRFPETENSDGTKSSDEYYKAFLKNSKTNEKYSGLLAPPVQKNLKKDIVVNSLPIQKRKDTANEILSTNFELPQPPKSHSFNSFVNIEESNPYVWNVYDIENPDPNKTPSDSSNNIEVNVYTLENPEPGSNDTKKTTLFSATVLEFKPTVKTVKKENHTELRQKPIHPIFQDILDLKNQGGKNKTRIINGHGVASGGLSVDKKTTVSVSTTTRIPKIVTSQPAKSSTPSAAKPGRNYRSTAKPEVNTRISTKKTSHSTLSTKFESFKTKENVTKTQQRPDLIALPATLHYQKILQTHQDAEFSDPPKIRLKTPDQKPGKVFSKHRRTTPHQKTSKVSEKLAAMSNRDKDLLKKKIAELILLKKLKQEAETRYVNTPLPVLNPRVKNLPPAKPNNVVKIIEKDQRKENRKNSTFKKHVKSPSRSGVSKDQDKEKKENNNNAKVFSDLLLSKSPNPTKKSIPTPKPISTPPMTVVTKKPKPQFSPYYPLTTQPPEFYQLKPIIYAQSNVNPFLHTPSINAHSKGHFRGVNETPEMFLNKTNPDGVDFQKKNYFGPTLPDHLSLKASDTAPDPGREDETADLGIETPTNPTTNAPIIRLIQPVPVKVHYGKPSSSILKEIQDYNPSLDQVGPTSPLTEKPIIQVAQPRIDSGSQPHQFGPQIPSFASVMSDNGPKRIRMQPAGSKFKWPKQRLMPKHHQRPYPNHQHPFQRGPSNARDPPRHHHSIRRQQGPLPRPTPTSNGIFRRRLGKRSTSPSDLPQLPCCSENALEIEDYVYPRVAFSINGNWMYIVNIPGKLEYQQGVSIKSCRHSICRDCSRPEEQRVYNCDLRFIQKKLMALAPIGNRLVTELFWLPNSCECQISKKK